MLNPGKCRIIELAEKCGVSRTTGEKLVSRYFLTETPVLFNGREVAGVDLTSDDIQKIALDYPRVLQPISMQNAYDGNTLLTSQPNSNDSLIKELRNRINTLESENTSLQSQSSAWKVQEATLLGELNQQKTLVEQLSNRLNDKDALIATLKSESEAQKLRAEVLNNQVATNNSMVQYNKGASAEFEKLRQMIADLQETKISPDDTEKKKNGFSLFGFQIGK